MKRIMLSAIGIGMLAVAARPALVIEITALTIDPIGPLVPGHTGVTITGKVVCDVTGTVNLEFVLVTQTKKKTQFGFASTVPYAAVPCGPFVTSWMATPVIDFSKSALLHKGKAGVQVQFDDATVVCGPACGPVGGDPAHLVSALVWLQ